MMEYSNEDVKVCIIETVEKVTFYKRGDWIYIGFNDRVWLILPKEAFDLVVRAFAEMGADLGIVDRFINEVPEIPFRCPVYGSA